MLTQRRKIVHLVLMAGLLILASVGVAEFYEWAMRDRGDDFAYVSYPEGKLGAKLLHRADGSLLVVTCFQRTDSPTTFCWDKAIK